ncbi:RNA-directed DNA polymerase, eukaryota, reverse transcriptase zinc-binding domain protein [Tanacetum coccineum]
MEITVVTLVEEQMSLWKVALEAEYDPNKSAEPNRKLDYEPTLLGNVQSCERGRHGLGEMFSNDNEVYYFKFKNKEGLNFVLENNPWMVSGRPLIVQKRSPKVTLDKHKLEKIPLWVNMFDIPLKAWNNKGISQLASSIGKPLIMDVMTANMCQYGRGRLGYARVWVEVDARKQFKDGIDVQYGDSSGNTLRRKKSRIEYLWKPSVC